MTNEDLLLALNDIDDDMLDVHRRDPGRVSDTFQTYADEVRPAGEMCGPSTGMRGMSAKAGDSERPGRKAWIKWSNGIIFAAAAVFFAVLLVPTVLYMRSPEPPAANENSQFEILDSRESLSEQRPDMTAQYPGTEETNPSPEPDVIEEYGWIDEAGEEGWAGDPEEIDPEPEAEHETIKQDGAPLEAVEEAPEKIEQGGESAPAVESGATNVDSSILYYSTLEEAEAAVGFSISVPEEFEGFILQQSACVTSASYKYLKLDYKDLSGGTFSVLKVKSNELVIMPEEDDVQYQTTYVEGKQVEFFRNRHLKKSAFWEDASFSYAIIDVDSSVLQEQQIRNLISEIS